MRYSLAPLALAAFAAAAPQGVSSAIAPQSSAPAGCSPSRSGTFNIQIVNVTTASSKTKRQSSDPNYVSITLNNGQLMDAQGRTGYIASNDQLQFDAPPQNNAIYTSGFSVCQNNSLALGGSAIWYACLSGSFYNLYDASRGAQCSQVYIEAINGGSSSATGGATQSSDGQVAASTAASSAKPVSQISDGQIQASTSAAKPVSQISDGQIQASTAPAMTTPTGNPVSQISDGQIQASTAQPTGKPVSQISDGQIQASTAKATGGATGYGNGTMATATPSVVPYTGGAAAQSAFGGLFVAVAGLAVALL